MNGKGNSQDDPVVGEVRAARARLWREGGETMEGLARLVNERVKTLRKGRRITRGKSTRKA